MIEGDLWSRVQVEKQVEKWGYYSNAPPDAETTECIVENTKHEIQLVAIMEIDY